MRMQKVLVNLTDEHVINTNRDEKEQVADKER